MNTSGLETIFLFLMLSLAFGMAAIILSWIVQPKSTNEEKISTYECGMNLESDSRVQFNVKYYMYALMFLVFDIETIFLYPWAVVEQRVGIFALCEAFIFIGILAFGLFWAYKQDLLKWE
jgi:NADH-quinone oxidoreductase subunit A